jgi:hypothetical protein
MEVPYPDEDRPLLQMSLKEFVKKAKDILGVKDDIHRFCLMVLAGRVVEDGVEHRITLNARQDLEAIRPIRYKMTRDYDSVTACTKTLPFNIPLSVYPVAPFRDTLTTDNHLMGKAYDKDVSGKRNHIMGVL